MASRFAEVSAGSNLVHTDLEQPSLGGLIARGGQPDNGEPCPLQPRDGALVEPAQVRGNEHGPTGAGSGRGQQVGQIDAAPGDRDPERFAAEGGDERRLHARVADRRQDGQRHGPYPWTLVGPASL